MLVTAPVGYLGTSMSSAYELVIDNAKIQIHCNDSEFVYETLVLDPFMQTDGWNNTDYSGPQELYGGSGITLGDGSDETGVYLSTQNGDYLPLTSSWPVAVYYKSPLGFTPVAMAFRMRAQTGPCVQLNYWFSYSFCPAAGDPSLPNSDPLGFIAHGILAHGAAPSDLGYWELSQLMYPYDGGVPNFTEYDFMWRILDTSLSPTDPSNNWWVFDTSVSGGADDRVVSALAGDGMRVDWAVSESAATNHDKQQVIQMSKMQMLLYGHY